MRINYSNLNLQGSSHTVKSVSQSTQMTSSFVRNSSAQNTSSEPSTSVSIGVISTFGKEETFSMTDQAIVTHQKPSLPSEDDSGLSSKERIRKQIIEQLMSRLTGKNTNFSVKKLSIGIGYNSSGGAVHAINSDVRRIVSTVTNTTEITQNSASFIAQGTVQTTDGRTINLNLNFNVNQNIVKSTTMVAEVQQRLLDPLVINFEGPMAKFSGDTMSFDIDCDGNLDDIGKMTSGSGYLAIDKNDNGEIDDGSELFGPATNDGFSELAKYDDDGNGWIDEADKIFDKLKIWYHDENGESQLVALKDKDVGAIYLGHAATNFDLYAGEQNMGRVRESGFVLLESGQSRVMQEMDLRI